jgi:hypothetical protein
LDVICDGDVIVGATASAPPVRCVEACEVGVLASDSRASFPWQAVPLEVP